jgi:hypothetical protein
MNFDKVIHAVSRLLLLGALALVVLATLEGVANFLGYTITRGAYSGGRLLEFAGVLLTFVMVTILREVRDELRNRPK